MAGIGPCPMAGMLLADMGAEVVCIARTAERPPELATDVSLRGKKSLILDLKKPEGAAALLRLMDKSDVLIEGYRPGVAERLGVGPEVCLSRNPALVYGRMTGWGQSGPLAAAAGHDINYIALSGALHAIGRPGEPPVIPINLIGDMGGGGMLLAYGVVCAVLEARRSGKGQVVDASMVEGSAQLLWMLPGLMAAGLWNASERGVNMLDGGAHFYNTYETADGKYVAIGSIEPQFYARLLECTGVDAARFAGQNDRQRWPELKKELAQVFKTKTRDEWCRLMEGTDVCFAPVLSFPEAPAHPHNRARKAFVTVDGVVQPAPAPRFSRTVPEVRHGGRPNGADSTAVLSSYGFSTEEIATLRQRGTLQGI